ncbi:MAG: 2-oxo acid dehydrogenase subunit E2 [Pseudonocardiales bacterium]|nr:2-oxo acid dehydrogenase subunit E2 [Pseudonocardiales bacterium]
MRKEFALPDAGEGLTEAEILVWRVAPGDTVTQNQTLVEIETAKAAVELPSPWSGVVAELLAEPGATVSVGTPIIAIDTEPAGGSDAPAAPTTQAADPARNLEPKRGVEDVTDDNSAPNGPHGGAEAPAEKITTLVGYGPQQKSSSRRRRRQPAATAQAAPIQDRRERTSSRADRGPTSTRGDLGGAAPTPSSNGDRVVPLAKPPVRKLARDLGVDLRTVTGSGPNGVITREDLQQPPPPRAPPPTRESRRVPIKGVRKAMAQAMTESAFTAPHVTEFLTVDVTAMMELRERLGGDPQFAGVKLTPLVFAAKAVCLAAARTPEINSSWNGEAGEIVYHGAVHLGIAAATPRGLVVPNIADADTLSLRELAQALSELTDTARAGTTTPADMLGGTFTITNVGVFGVDTGTPIINPGQAAILALGAVKPAPWVVDGELAVRTVCQLSLSFDHRLVDGEQGSRFLADVGSLLSDPALALAY